MPKWHCKNITESDGLELGSSFDYTYISRDMFPIHLFIWETLFFKKNLLERTIVLKKSVSQIYKWLGDQTLTVRILLWTCSLLYRHKMNYEKPTTSFFVEARVCNFVYLLSCVRFSRYCKSFMQSCFHETFLLIIYLFRKHYSSRKENSFLEE